GFNECGNQSEMFRFMFLGKVAPEHEDFFRMEGIESSTRRPDPASLGKDGERIPRFARAIAIEMAGPKVSEDLRGWDNHELNIAFGIDVVAAQPVAQHETVR